MFTLKTLARLETARIESEKAAKSIQNWKMIRKLLIAIFLLVVKVLIELIK